jgi:hypothetical protein
VNIAPRSTSFSETVSNITPASLLPCNMAKISRGLISSLTKDDNYQQHDRIGVKTAWSSDNFQKMKIRTRTPSN